MRKKMSNYLQEHRQGKLAVLFVLFGKLNAASSVRLKQVFQSVIQWYEAHSFGHFRQAILCGKTIMQIILHDGF